jgi:lysyl-tRNA synthetase class 2
LLALAGILDLVSALTPALSFRLQLLQELIGDNATRVSHTATVLAGLCALMLARSLAHRRKRAIHLALVAMLASAALNLLKALDVEEASFCLLVAGALWQARRDFVVGAMPISWRAALGRSSFLALLCVLYGEVGALLLGHQVRVLLTFGHSGRPIPFPLAAMAGLWSDAPTVLYLGGQGRWFEHSLHALAVALVLFALVRFLRPLFPVRPATEDERTRARAFVTQYGQDALSYFHLRPDRMYLFAPDGAGFVSYMVRGSVALLGGDPVAAPGRTKEVVRHALAELAAAGLTPCVVGASHEAMQVYRREGLHAMKIGEEAVLDLPSFTVAQLGKKVRRAARAIAAHGVEIQIGTMASLDATIVAQCRAVSDAWLQGHGGVEQGFSMTSGPIPSPSDQAHAVLAGVIRRDDGTAHLLGFISLAPVPAGCGLSLDHMRRRPEAPNGLMEALIIRAAEHFRDQGYATLSLNFAVLSDKECPEGEGTAIRAARSVVFEGVRYLPMRSLYQFNKKFEPCWSCRYLVYGGPASLLSAVYATIRAELSTSFLLPGFPVWRL